MTSGKVSVTTVKLVERPGGVVHSLRIRTKGDLRSKRNRRATTVKACCEHLEAERVVHALAGGQSEAGVRCDWSAAVLEDLVRSGLARDRALAWAALPIRPSRPHWMIHWKVRTRSWDLLDLDKWLQYGKRPEQIGRFLEAHPYKTAGVRVP